MGLSLWGFALRPLTGHTPGATPLLHVLVLHGNHKAEAVVGDILGTVG